MIVPALDWSEYLDGELPVFWDSLSPEERDELEALFAADQQNDDPSSQANE